MAKEAKKATKKTAAKAEAKVDEQTKQALDAPEMPEEKPADGTLYDGIHAVSAADYWGEDNEKNPSKPSHP